MSLTSGFIDITSCNAYFSADTITDDMLIRTGSNYQRIVFATLSTSNATMILSNNIVSFASNVGVGKSNPQYALDVNGVVNATSLYVSGAPYIGSQWTSSNNFVYVLGSNVGINKSNPAYLLDVNGTTNVQGQLIVNNDNGWTTGGIRFRSTNGTLDAAIVQGTNGAMYFRAPSYDGSLGYSFLNSNGASTLFNVLNTGFVGIGNAAPTTPLDIITTSAVAAGGGCINVTGSNNNERILVSTVGGESVIRLSRANGTVATQTAITNGQSLGIYQFGGHNGSGITRTAWIQAFSTENYSATNNGTCITFHTTPNGTTSLTERMRIDNNGYIGIGISNPGAIVHVKAPSGEFRLDGSNSYAGFSIVNNSNGSMALGLSYNPGQYSSSAGSNDVVLRGISTGKIHLQSGTGAAALTINSNNTIGIGTSSPAYNLDVSGTCQIAGGTYTTNAYSRYGVTIIDYKNPGGMGGSLTLRNSTGGGVLNSAASLAFELDGSTAYSATGTDEANGRISCIIDSSANNAGALTFNTWNGSANGERMRITSGGNVGIGVSNPTWGFQVNSTAATTSTVAAFANSTNTNYLALVSGNSSDVHQAIVYGSSTDLRFGTWATLSGAGWSEKMRMTTTGNFGIATTTPVYPLEVNGTVRFNAGNTVSNKLLVLYDPNTADAVSTATNFYGFGINNFTLRYQVPGTNFFHSFYCGSDFIAQLGRSSTGPSLSMLSGGYSLYQTGSYATPITMTIGFTSDATNGDGGKYVNASAIQLKAQDLTWGGGIRVYGGEIYIEGGKSPLAGIVHGNIILRTAGTDRMTITSSGVSINGSISKSSGSFDIPHPVAGSNVRLVHSFIEGPRADLIYRGRVKLTNGQANVNLNRDCTANGSTMMDGTFEALCRDPEVFLQNNETWDRVKGIVDGCTLNIVCENPTASNEVAWMVIAERKDQHIKEWDMTDSNGQLVLEYNYFP